MGINIRIVRKGHGSKKVLAELYNANPLELPIKTETINVDGFEEREFSLLQRCMNIISIIFWIMFMTVGLRLT